MELLWFHPDVPRGEMVGSQDKDGYNCLNDACYYGHLGLIEFFFNHWPKEDRAAGGGVGRKRSLFHQPSHYVQNANTGHGPHSTGAGSGHSGGHHESFQNMAAGGPESPLGTATDLLNSSNGDRSWDEDNISFVSEGGNEVERFPSLTDLIFSVSGGIGNCLHVSCSRGHMNIVEFLLSTVKGEIEKRGQNADGEGDVAGAGAAGTRSLGENVDMGDGMSAGSSGSGVASEEGGFGPETFYNIEDLVSSRNKHNATGLHLACIKGHIDIAKFLVDGTGLTREKKREFIGAQNKKGASCLHFAAYHGNVEVLLDISGQFVYHICY